MWSDLFQRVLAQIDEKYRPKRAEVYDIFKEELDRGYDSRNKEWTINIVGKLVEKIIRSVQTLSPEENGKPTAT